MLLVIVSHTISPSVFLVKYVPFENAEPVLGVNGIRGHHFVPCGLRVTGTFLEARISFSTSASHFFLRRIPVTPSVQNSFTPGIFPYSSPEAQVEIMINSKNS